MVKKLFVIFLLLSGLLITRHVYFYPCAEPILYKLGNIDPKFNLSQSQLLTDTLKAESVWENPSGINLFAYDPQAVLSINFVYDSRQDLKTQINKQQDDLQKQENSLESQIAKYKQQVAVVDNKITALNNEINSWNSKGGAPEEEYNKLVIRQKNLQQEANKLNAQASSLNQKAQNYNVGISTINKTIDDFNQVLTVKPEEGLYSPSDQTISIFFVTDKDELVHTLAHELGHARGLGHVDNQKAIMHPLTSRVTTVSVDDTTALQSVCQRVSYWTKICQYLQLCTSPRV